jgi:hypothetical protein
MTHLRPDSITENAVGKLAPAGTSPGRFKPADDS